MRRRQGDRTPTSNHLRTPRAETTALAPREAAADRSVGEGPRGRRPSSRGDRRAPPRRGSSRRRTPNGRARRLRPRRLSVSTPRGPALHGADDLALPYALSDPHPLERLSVRGHPNGLPFAASTGIELDASEHGPAGIDELGGHCDGAGGDAGLEI